jgi:flagellar assembly protein FliH
MSDVMMPDRLADTMRALTLADLGGGSGGFTRSHRYGGPPAASAPVKPVEEDPATQAFAAGYAQGAADAEAAFSEAIAQQDAARARLELAFGRLDADLVRDLEARLRETVLALCAPLIGAFATDPAALAHRVETAAAMLARAADERVIRLHPEDLALVGARLPEDWHFEPDPALERGALRVEGAAGGVEDSPAIWLRALSEALAAC